MRYPNRRYGNPAEMAYYTMGVPTNVIARRMRRDERTIRDWLSGRTKVPWWVPEILRLQHMENDLRSRQMGMGALAPRLGVVSADVVTLAPRRDEKKPQVSPGLADQTAPVITCA